MKKLCLFVVLCLSQSLIACGGEENTAPTISNLTVTSSVTRGATATGMMDVSDPDGLEGLVMQMSFRGPASIELEVALQGVSGDIKSAPVLLPFELSPAAPAGDYTLSVQARDSDGALSNTLESAFTAN